MKAIRQRSLWKWDDVVSLAASVFACIILSIPILQGEISFAILAGIALVEGVITFFNASIKNKMIACIFETVHAFLFSLVIVLFAVFERSDKVVYPLIITVLAVVTLVKGGIAVYHVRKYGNARNIDYHTSGNHNFISALTYLQMLWFVIVSLFRVSNPMLCRLIADLVLNFIVTNIVTTVAMFMLVRMYTDEKLTFVEKVRFIVSTLIEKDVFIYIGFFFSFMVALFTLLTALNSEGDAQTGYYALGGFYLTIFITRIVSHFLWKKASKREYDEAQLQKARARLSLFVSIALLVEGETIGTALMFFMQNKAQDQTPLWWFFLFLLPFALWRGVSCTMYLIKSRKSADLRIKAYGAIDLISAGFSLCGVLSMIYYYLGQNENWLLLVRGFAVIWQISAAVATVKLFVESIIGLAKKKPKTPKVEENETHP